MCRRMDAFRTVREITSFPSQITKNRVQMVEPQVSSDESQQSVSSDEAEAFASHAEDAAPGLVAEFAEFLVENKAWWLLPILIALTLIGAAVWLSGSAVAPFIYPLF